jgi:alpha-tubulin suppressor-like RCC1 family protein
LPNFDKSQNSSNNENINDPTNISIIYKNLKALEVSCGNEHSLILSKDKNVYGIGNNEDGLLGQIDKELKTYKPIKINFMTKNSENRIEEYNGKIKNISCGTVHNLALTDDGNIFSWGSFQGGQLGISSELLLNTINIENKDKKLFLNIPSLIPFFQKNSIKIEKISCGEAHSLALSEKGKVYSWGFGSNGQLGLGFCEDSFEPGQGLLKSRIFEPELIKYYKDYNNNNSKNLNKNILNNNLSNTKIKDIECGKTFSMFINNGNNLYACGINDLRQLGFKDLEPKDYNVFIPCDDYIYPSLLKCFDNKKVEKISCGEGHCLAVVNDINNNSQSIWSWGNNKFGQLGHGSIVKISLPKEIEYFSEYNINNFAQVSCGGFHSLCLLGKKNNLDWIDKDYDECILDIIKEIGTL